MRHGAEPWEELAVKLMLKWPGLYYMTSAFAPKYYPKAIVDYANTRGADKILYAGYYPMGLSLERIFSEMPDVPFRDHVWPKFLRENAVSVFKVGPRDVSHRPGHRRRALPADLGRHAWRREPRAVPRVPRPRVPRRVRRVAQPLQEPVPGPPRPPARPELGRRPSLGGAGDRRHRRRGDLPEHRAAVLPDRRGDRPARRSPEEFPRRLAGIHAHNRWLADFVLASRPNGAPASRRSSSTTSTKPSRDVQWAKEHGLRGGVLLPGRPDDCTWVAPLYDPVYDPFVGRVPGPRRHDHAPRRAGLARLRQVPVRDDALGRGDRRGSRTVRSPTCIVGGVFERFPGLASS